MVGCIYLRIPSHSASYNHHHHHYHSTSCNVCIQYMHHCSREKVQTTTASYCGPGPAPVPFRPPHVPERTCAQWLKMSPPEQLRRVRTFIATVGVHDAVSTCNLHNGKPLNCMGVWVEIQWHTLMQVTCACCIVSLSCNLYIIRMNQACT